MTVATSSRPGLEHELAASRRVDWRFLTDDPVPDVVVTAGRPDGALLAGLQATAKVVNDQAHASSPPALTAVAGAIDDTALSRAVAHVPPGGWLVAETHGMLGRLRRPLARERVAGTSRVARVLRDSAFEAVEVHLPLPGRAAATAFVSLSGEGSLAAWLDRSRGTGKARLSRLAGHGLRAGARSGVLAALAPEALVVGRRPSDPVPVGSRAGWLRSRLAELAATGDVSIDPSTAEILLLTPRYRPSAHVVALVVTRDDDGWRTRLVIKAGRLADAPTTLDQEVTALRGLAATLGATGHAPLVLAADVTGSPPWLIETAIDGRALDPASVRRDRDAAADAIAEFVARLPIRAEVAVAGGARRLASEALERLGAAGVGGDLVPRSQRLIESLDDRLPVVFEHGDLAHPNLIRRPDGTLAAVDWERAKASGAPLHDLTVGLGYVAAAAVGARTPADQAAAFIGALDGEAGWAAPRIAAELDRLGIDRRLGATLATVAWIRTAAFLLDRAGDDWLEGNRSTALWRATLDAAERDRELGTR